MFDEEGFTDIETAAFERSLSAPPVQGYSFSVSVCVSECVWRGNFK
jgi:hypothetical protein